MRAHSPANTWVPDMLGLDLKGKRALVTGGSRGIGRATALLLARAGADVAISYLARREAADAVVTELEGHGVRAFAHPGDIADERLADQLVSRTVNFLGGIDLY